MSDIFPLTRELAAAAAPCFDTADRLAVYTEMNLGAQQHAIDDIICAVLREDHPIPAVLLDRLREWLAVGPIDDRGLARRACERRSRPAALALAGPLQRRRLPRKSQLGQRIPCHRARPRPCSTKSADLPSSGSRS